MLRVSRWSREPKHAAGRHAAFHIQSNGDLLADKPTTAIAPRGQQRARLRQREPQVHVVQARDKGDDIEPPVAGWVSEEIRMLDGDVVVGSQSPCRSVDRSGIRFDRGHGP